MANGTLKKLKILGHIFQKPTNFKLRTKSGWKNRFLQNIFIMIEVVMKKIKKIVI
ncbi:MAG: hypothetical protein LBC68_04380 [Prevotellaceae bacterium]|jgi:hypothetical protein|nr:hypothetical protein [Prevotellaceae bacterium]